ncbi:MAG: ATP-binding cassette domain-containing protein [Bacteroidota bacterium]|nr:ATP-binding cassette domain-containing protein [Bacteroidota bacterium]
MNSIRLVSVVPQVFAQQNNLDSEIWNQDIKFEKGQVYLIEADSGKGKSTFCSYIVGYRHDYAGKVLIDDQNALNFKVQDWVDLRQNHISHLFQELRLFPELTAFENVEIKNKLTNFKSEAQIKEWFDRLDIADKLDAKVGRMSFGQQQRVAMIRALVQPFDFLLADEPISHLDDSNSQLMGEILMEEAKAQGAGVILTSIGKHIALNYDKTIRL